MGGSSRGGVRAALLFLAAAAWAAAPSAAQQAPAAPAATPAVASAATAAPAAAPPATLPSSAAVVERAMKLMDKRLYPDAIALLEADVKARPEAQSGRQLLALAECYYMTGQYENARPYFVKAGRLLGDKKDQTVADFRLACVAYRLKDTAGAIMMTDAFVAKYSGSPQGGKLLVYKMQALADRGLAAQAEIEAIHARLNKEFRAADASVGMEADQALGAFYRQTGQDNKAHDMYASIVQNFRTVIAEMQANKRPVPVAFETSHDNAAVQLAMMSMEKKQTSEAMKWLENVKYNAALQQKARLLLAKLSYEKGDYTSVARHLTAEGYLDTIPNGPVRSDMCLLLGLAEKKANGDPNKTEAYLKQVASNSRGYIQAQVTLGDFYREKGLSILALQAYTNAVADPDYAPAALFHIAAIHINDASRLDDEIDAKILYRKAGDALSQLMTKYPIAREAKEAAKPIELLASKGVTVSYAAQGDQDRVKAWEKIAAAKPGSYEAVQALLSVVRLKFKTVMEEKTGRVLQAPDYATCAATCDRLLDKNVYTGQGCDAAVWKQIRAEALYIRGKCELASLAPASDASAQSAKPVYLPAPESAKAMVYLQQAKELADPKQLDLVKNIEIALLEAMFKSDHKDVRQQAEKRFQEMTDNFGEDPNFQMLGIELAEWCKENGRFADAARHYAGVADRGRNMTESDALRVRYAAGMLYSKAAEETRRQSKDIRYAIYIYPKEEISAAADLAKTYEPLRMPVTMRWPGGGNNITAEVALRALSRAAKLPFIWATNAGETAVDTYLKQKQVSLADGPTTVAQALQTLLDGERHRLDFDIGLVEGTPTIAPPKADTDDPEEAARSWKVIELYDLRDAALRYKPLTRQYGAWNKIHGQKPQILYNILRRVEEVSATRTLWAEGVDKDEKQAVEFQGIPGTNVNAEATCAEALANTLASLGLKYKIVPRELSADYYDAAKDQFSKIRQVNPRSKWAEKAMYQWWLNYYAQQDYPKMKVVLREYLKVFDNASYDHYRSACFWEGWTWEYEKNYSEACRCYARAAEERLVIIKPPAMPAREELKKQFSYDTLFAVSAPVSGVFTNSSVVGAIELVRVNTRVELRVEPGVAGLEAAFNPGEVRAVPALDLLCDALEPVGLSIRVENIDPDLAEKSYFRIMTCYKKDDLMPQALENATLLLARYPQSKRKKDTYQMMLDIYKGLKDYGNVLAVLGELAKNAADDSERFKFDYEKGSILFDMADYAQAAEIFKALLGKAAGVESVYAREAYAKSLMRMEKHSEALAQFQALLKEERDPLRLFIDKVLIFCLQLSLGGAEEKDFSAEWTQYSVQYGQLSDEARGRLTADEITRAMWIYFAQAMLDLRKGRLEDAKLKLNAVTTAPDDFLAADAGYRLGMIYLGEKQYTKARESFEYLLVFTKSAESAVRATYALARCLEAMGNSKAAAEKDAQLVARYPLSPFVALIKKNSASPQSQPAPAPKAP